MARDCQGTGYMRNTSAPVSAYPLTMACWFTSVNLTSRFGLMCIGDTGSDNNYFLLACAGELAGDPVVATVRSGGANNDAASTAGYTVGPRYHACGVFTSATSRTAYINGGSGGSNTTNSTPAGVDTTTIGRLERLTPANTLNGIVCEAALWDVALTAGEVAELGAAVSPLFVRPENLVSYWPIFGYASPEIDVIGALPMTVTGTVKVDHGRILYPARRKLFLPAVAAAPAATSYLPLLGVG